MTTTNTTTVTTTTRLPSWCRVRSWRTLCSLGLCRPHDGSRCVGFYIQHRDRGPSPALTTTTTAKPPKPLPNHHHHHHHPAALVVEDEVRGNFVFPGPYDHLHHRPTTSATPPQPPPPPPPPCTPRVRA